jgi:hypothetical protein
MIPIPDGTHGTHDNGAMVNLAPMILSAPLLVTSKDVIKQRRHQIRDFFIHWSLLPP